VRLESYEGSDEDGSDGSGGSTDGTKPAGLAISSLYLHLRDGEVGGFLVVLEDREFDAKRA